MSLLKVLSDQRHLGQALWLRVLSSSAMVRLTTSSGIGPKSIQSDDDGGSSGPVGRTLEDHDPSPNGWAFRPYSTSRGAEYPYTRGI